MVSVTSESKGDAEREEEEEEARLARLRRSGGVSSAVYYKSTSGAATAALLEAQASEAAAAGPAAAAAAAEAPAVAPTVSSSSSSNLGSDISSSSTSSSSSSSSGGGGGGGGGNGGSGSGSGKSNLSNDRDLFAGAGGAREATRLFKPETVMATEVSWGSAIFFAAVSCVLLSFGVWQLRRREWKQSLMDFKDERLARAPVGLGRALNAAASAFGPNDTLASLVAASRKSYSSESGDALGQGSLHPSIDQAALDQFLYSLTALPVFCKGTLDYKAETLVGPTPMPMDPRNVQKRDLASGYSILTPMRLDSPVSVTLPAMVFKAGGEHDPTRPQSLTISSVLVNRGWISRDQVVTYLHNRIREPASDDPSTIDDPSTTAGGPVSSPGAAPAALDSVRVPVANVPSSAALSVPAIVSAGSWWWPFGGSAAVPVRAAASGSAADGAASAASATPAAPAAPSSVLSGVAWLGVSPPATADGKPVMHTLRSGTRIFHFLDARAIAKHAGIPDATTVQFASDAAGATSSATSTFRPPVFVVDCLDPAPPAQMVSSLDDDTHPRTRLRLLRRTEDDHRTFLTSPGQHLGYALTWFGLGGAGLAFTYRRFFKPQPALQRSIRHAIRSVK